jgi:hypothetical protein
VLVRRPGRLLHDPPGEPQGAADPGFEGHAEWVDGRPDLETALLRAYRTKYWLLVPLWMGRYIRRRLGTKESVLVRVTPRPAA